MSNSEKAEELLNQSKEQRRHTTEDSDSPDLPAAIRDAFQAIDAGEEYTNLTLRDARLAALFCGLEEADELEPLAEAAHEAAGRDADTEQTTVASALRSLVRVGLQEVSPELLEQGREGYQLYLTEQADDF